MLREAWPALVPFQGPGLHVRRSYQGHQGLRGTKESSTSLALALPSIQQEKVTLVIT